VTYHEYLTELTYVLFLKLADELGIEDQIPEASRWRAVMARVHADGLSAYQVILDELGRSPNPHLKDVFQDAKTRIRTDAGAQALLDGVDAIAWSQDGRVEIGEVYEGLIQKSAQEARYGAGQYFTPRRLVDTIVGVLKPDASDTVYDPAAGTGGFLVAAGSYVAGGTNVQPQLFGVEVSADVHRLGAANLLLHGLSATYVIGDALTDPGPIAQCSLCITNPPFGVKGSIAAGAARDLDFPTSNKQLAFLQHVYRSLGPKGRAGVIVPDNVLFEEGVARSVRAKLLDDFTLHTVLRLPAGIFYASGVKTAVLFFASRPDALRALSDRVWFYDLRANGSRGEPSAEAFAAFRRAYGTSPYGASRRRRSGLFHWMTRAEIAEHGDRLDFAAESASENLTDRSPAAQIDIMQRELADIQQSLKSLVDQLGKA
jgi:type I restriction enzyme M protein